VVENGFRGHLSLHIEKTAGTSFEKFLVDFYGQRQVFLYKRDGDQLIRSDNLLDIVKLNPLVDKIRTLSGPIGVTPLAHWLVLRLLDSQNHGGIRKLPRKWSAIHGHFDIDRFDQFTKNPFRTVILRDPLERAISHFRYWERAKGVVTHRIDVPYDSTINFRDFILLDDLQNYQSKALGGTPLECFDAVGVTENLEAFISDFVYKRKQIRSQIVEVPHLNRSFGGVDLTDLGIDNEFEKRFKSLNQLDYENYQKAQKLCGLYAS
jgi:hypothetical protein